MHSAETRHTFGGQGAAGIAVAASLIGLALVALVAMLVAARSAGFVRIAAQALAVLLGSLTGALLGFFLPAIPLAGGLRGDALAAGILGTLGTIGGMSVAEYCMAWFEKPL